MIFPIKLVKLCILLVHIVEIGESSPRDYGVVVYSRRVVLRRGPTNGPGYYTL